AEADLARTKRAVETTLAEAKATEAKLAETKRAVEKTLAEAKPPDLRPAVETRYIPCESCGTVTSVVTRFLDNGSNRWEIRVNFGSGASRTFLYPTDPGFWNGERVRLESGRLTRM
ncbi:MAG TPA: hypothetical protein VNG33_06535, partial [Polyangiaceae bacterium]|nr:hypothetical protein [Polyangiaceae bacterium]